MQSDDHKHKSLLSAAGIIPVSTFTIISVRSQEEDLTKALLPSENSS